MKTRLLSIALALCMALSLTPVAYAAEGNTGASGDGGTTPVETTYVAAIGGTQYETLDSAFDAVQDGETVVLLADINLESDLTIGTSVQASKAFTLELDGHTLSAGENTILIQNGVSLIVKNAQGISRGGIESNDSLEVSAAALTLESGNITVENGYGIFANNGGTVVVNNAYITSKYAALSGNNTTGDMNFEVNGGRLMAEYGPAIYMPGQVSLSITGGTINGGISLRMGQVDVSGGSINAALRNIDSVDGYYNYSGNAWLADALYVFNGTYTSENEEYGNSLNLNITGGTFTCANKQGSAIAIYDLGKVGQESNITISGDAKFTTDASDRNAYDVLGLEDIGGSDPAAGYNNSDYVGKVNTIIKGGVFSTEVDGKYLATGYKCTGNAGEYTVQQSDEGAMVVTPSVGENSVSATLDGVYKGSDTEITNGSDDSSASDDSGSVANGAVTINLKSEQSDATSSAELTVTRGAAQSFADNGAQSLTVQTDIGDVTFDQTALKKMGDEVVASDVVISVTENKESGDGVLASYSVSATNQSGENLLPYGAAGNGSVTIVVDKPGDAADTLQAWYAVQQSGNKSWLCVEQLDLTNREKGKVAITIGHLSTVVLTNGTPTNKSAATVTGADGNTTACADMDALNAAISNAASSVTVALQNDLDGTLSIPAGKEVAVNGGGHTITGSVSCMVQSGENASSITTNLTLKQLNLVGNEKATYGITSQNNKATTVSGLNLTMQDCTVKGYASKAIYLTNAIGLDIDRCVFENNATGQMGTPNISGDYTIDLNLMNVKAGALSIKNTTFKGDCGDKAVVKVAARGGASDTWKGQDIPEKTETTVDSLTITGCTFSDTPAADADVNIGTDSKVDKGWTGEGDFATNTTGAFKVEISDNETPVVVNPAYLTYKASDGKYYLATGNGNKSVENIEVPAGYTYTKNADDHTTSGTVTAPSTPGGGGTTAPSYDIAIAQPADGTIAVDPTSAKEGDTVTVTVMPDEGYALSELTVTDEDGNPLKLTANADGTYSFEMPAGMASVSATFVCNGGALCPSHGFTDVDQSQWYHAAIDWAVDNGVMSGYANTALFGPLDGLMREQAATVLWNVQGDGVENAPAAPQTDVDQFQWYAPYVNWAVAEGVMNGYSGSALFGIGQALTREEFAAVVANAAGADVASADPAALEAFEDPSSVSGWAVPVVAWAVENGVLNGIDLGDGVRALEGGRTVTRAEMAAMVMNAVDAGVLEL